MILQCLLSSTQTRTERRGLLLFLPPCFGACPNRLETVILDNDDAALQSSSSAAATVPVSLEALSTTPGERITCTASDATPDIAQPTSPQCTPARGMEAPESPRHRAEVAGAAPCRTPNAQPPSSNGGFLSPPPRMAHLMAPMATPSPTRGLNVLAECSFELGPALCTPMTERESQQMCKQTNYHGVTFHEKKGKYLTRCVPCEHMILVQC